MSSLGGVSTTKKSHSKLGKEGKENLKETLWVISWEGESEGLKVNKKIGVVRGLSSRENFETIDFEITD